MSPDGNAGLKEEGTDHYDEADPLKRSELGVEQNAVKYQLVEGVEVLEVAKLGGFLILKCFELENLCDHRVAAEVDHENPV